MGAFCLCSCGLAAAWCLEIPVADFVVDPNVLEPGRAWEDLTQPSACPVQSRPGLPPWQSLAEVSGVFAGHVACFAVLVGLYPAVLDAVVSPCADKSQGRSSCGGSACSALVLIPGTSATIIHTSSGAGLHQGATWQLVWLLHLFPGWESAWSGHPEGPRQEAHPVSLALGWVILWEKQIQQGLWCLCFPSA